MDQLKFEIKITTYAKSDTFYDKLPTSGSFFVILGGRKIDSIFKVKAWIVCVKEALSFEGKEVYSGWLSDRIGNG